jgi:hypothetical protein
MYQYTSGEYSDNNADTTGKITLTQLQSQLASGPIFIGEDHAKPFAREAIEKLIIHGNVKKLFLELPNIEADIEIIEGLGFSMSQLATYLSSASSSIKQDQDMEGNVLTLASRMEGMSGRNNPFKLRRLIKTALDKGGISIYFHDSPVGGEGKVIINGKSRSQKYAGSIEGVQERNKESKVIIKRNNLGEGTIILAGYDHLDPKEVGGENTLQYLLEYENDRIFDLSTKPIESDK